jgi:hypothetical protein
MGTALQEELLKVWEEMSGATETRRQHQRQSRRQELYPGSKETLYEALRQTAVLEVVEQAAESSIRELCNRFS